MRAFRVEKVVVTMEENKTVAERLRKANKSCRCDWLSLYKAVTGELFDCNKTKCEHCFRIVCRELADMIEAEKTMYAEHCANLAAERVRDTMKERTKTEQNEVDVDALLNLADKISDMVDVPPYKCLPIAASTAREWKDTIRNAVKGAKPQLPEGIEWPRFEDGELVKFGDKFEHDGITDTVEQFTFREAGFWVYGNGDPAWELYSWGEPVKRPEPEVLDVDGVPIKVGDTVWDGKGNSHEVISIESRDEDEQIVWCGEYLGSIKFCYVANELTHRKPDTFESVVAEMLADFDNNDSIEVDGYFDRLRKLLGGE